MINKETVLVLGAGASIPYGFPSGQGLIDLICEGDLDFKRVLAEAGLDSGEVSVAGFMRALREADPESIDVFLANNPEFQKLGKTAIAATLLPLERESELIEKWRDLRLNHQKAKLGGHWYKYLSNLLQANSSFEEFGQNKLSVITFNYDRALEHYLFTTLKASFHKRSGAECAERLNVIKVIHIYGQLGYLPWQAYDGPKIPFGGGLPADHGDWILTIRRAIQTIKTMSDDFEEDNPDIKLAREILSTAETIYFLGFGYHPVNLRILGMKSLGGDKNIRGTSLGLSLQRRLEVGRLGVRTLKFDPKRMNAGHLYDEDVYEFLHKHSILE
ncbi:MAG: hypothetical protein ACYTEL_15500 [Planctomycetota bacterium]|jgi:hypothetical protein